MKDFTKEDRAQRERLERQTSAGVRVDRVGTLNKAIAAHAAREVDGLAAIGILRLTQRGHAADVRQHNRAHADWMQKAGNQTRTLNTASTSPNERMVDPRRQQRRIDGRDWDTTEDATPGVGKPDRDDARDSDYTPALAASGRVTDAGGAMHGARSTEDGANDGSDHWSHGEVESVKSVLSIEDMRALASRKWRGRFW